MEDREVEPLLNRMDELVRRVPQTFARFIAPRIKWENRLVGVKGARGCGKTTLMRQHVRLEFESVKV